MNKYVTVFVAAAMLAMSGAAAAGDPGTWEYNANSDKWQCKGGSYCAGNPGGTTTTGGTGGNGGAASATGGNATANAGAIAAAGAVAGAAVVGSGNSDVDVKNTNTALGGAVVGSGNSDVRNTVTTSNIQGQQQGQLQGQVAFGGDSTVKVGDTTVEGSTSSSTLNVAAGAVQGTQTQTANGGQGGSIVINGAAVGEGSGSAPFSSSASATVAEGAVATSQTQTATGGNVEEGAVANNVDVNVTVEQPADTGSREIAPVVKNVLPAASAAPSFASICTAGMAGQSTSYGISLATTSAACRHLMAADALMAVGDREKALKHVYAAAKHASVKGFMAYITTVLTLGIIE